jgi:hypothetical protein
MAVGRVGQARLDPAEERCCVTIDLPLSKPAPQPGQ